MRAICFYFQVHQPFRLRRYRFFDIGDSHDYFDHSANRGIMQKVSGKCYLPMNRLLLDLIARYGERFKVSFSISGVALQQFAQYAPEVLESFRQLASTGCVEFLAETYAHSLSSLSDGEEFKRQVAEQHALVQQHFGQSPTTFRNTELIYSDAIGALVSGMGYGQMLTEGARHIMGWRSPNYVYTNALEPRLKLLLKNFQLSDDIAFRFSNQGWSGWPLTSEKYANWLSALPSRDEIVNLFMDYETFGEHQWESSGIFDFFRSLPEAIFSRSDYHFLTPSEVVRSFQPVGALHVPHPISWADEERDLTAWLGNELQNEAFRNLNSLADRVRAIDDAAIHRDWLYLQTSDHFYYMCTKWFSDGDVHKYFNPFESPYDAFVTYMNVLSDFMLRLRRYT